MIGWKGLRWQGTPTEPLWRIMEHRTQKNMLTHPYSAAETKFPNDLSAHNVLTIIVKNSTFLAYIWIVTFPCFTVSRVCFYEIEFPF